MPAWAGLWDNQHGQPYALTGEPGSAARSVARIMAPQAQQSAGALGVALSGQAVGANASANLGQVKSQQADGFNIGGAVPIVNSVVINRATVAADETALDNSLQPKFAPTTYPPDKSGNGGGGMLGKLSA